MLKHTKNRSPEHQPGDTPGGGGRGGPGGPLAGESRRQGCYVLLCFGVFVMCCYVLLCFVMFCYVCYVLVCLLCVGALLKQPGA